MADEKLNLTEEVTSLFEGIEISSEEVEKFGIALEAVVSEKVRTLAEEAKEEQMKELEESKAEYEAELEENVNKYLEYVVSEWMEENRLSVEDGLKLNIVENFIEGMKDLFVEHYIEVPEGKEDILESEARRAESLNEELNEKLNENIELKTQLKELKKERVVSEASQGLTDTQKEKLASLVEDVEYSDEESYAEKVKVVRESFFKEEKSEKEVVTEETKEVITEATNDRMKAYLSAL